MLDAGIGQDGVAGLVFVGPDHRLALAVAEIIDAGAGDVLELDGQDARFSPLALVAEGDVADHGLESVGADVVGDLVLVEALRALDRVAPDLEVRVRPRDEVIAERVRSPPLAPVPGFCRETPCPRGAEA